MLHAAVICKANLFRSPAARVYLADAFGEAGIEAVVTSAGVLPGGNVVAPEYLQMALEAGIDLSDHVSAQVTPASLEAQDLVLTMTRELLREVVVLAPPIWPRAFTMREFLRRASMVGPRKPTQALEVWLETVQRGRTRGDLLGDLEADDVADPVGGTAEDYRLMLRQVQRLSTDIAALF